MRIASSPVYLDTSALAKIYVAEAESRMTAAARETGVFELPAV